MTDQIEELREKVLAVLRKNERVEGCLLRVDRSGRKCMMDLSGLKDESLEDSENLSEPEVLAMEIVENLQSALEQFLSISEDLEEKDGPTIG